LFSKTYEGAPPANTLILHAFSGAQPLRKLTYDLRLLTGAGKHCANQCHAATQNRYAAAQKERTLRRSIYWPKPADLRISTHATRKPPNVITV